jgi:hypothetical protein
MTMSIADIAIQSVAHSKTTPTQNTQGKVCYADVFRLTDLPTIMDAKQWPISAILMRKWFASPAHTMSSDEKQGKTDARSYPANLVDTSTVKMSWALSFPRIKSRYEQIFGSTGLFGSKPAVYESTAARKELIKKLIKAGKFGLNREAYGELGASVLEVNDLWQFQFHKIGGKEYNAATYGEAAAREVFQSDPGLDDMWGALADTLFKIAAAGFVTPKLKEVDTGLQCGFEAEYYEVSVDTIGVYLRDTYDFNGDQYLGHWSKSSAPYIRLFAMGASRGSCPNDYVEVSNKHFRTHRQVTNKGGDLLIFSDVLQTRLKKPFTFRVSPEELRRISGEKN